MTVVAHPRSMAELLSNKYAHFDQEQILSVSYPVLLAKHSQCYFLSKIHFKYK